MNAQVSRIERAVARRRVLSRLLQEEATLESFAKIRSTREGLGLYLSRASLKAWEADADAMATTLAELRPVIKTASEIERQIIGSLVAQLDLPFSWRAPNAWLLKWLATAFQRWTSWIDERDPSAFADVRTLVLTAHSATTLAEFKARNAYRWALGLGPSAGPVGGIAVSPGFAGKARELVSQILAEAGFDEDQREVALTEFDSRFLVADSWYMPILDLLEVEAIDPHLPPDLPIPPAYLGQSGASSAKRRVDEIAEEMKALIAARSAEIDRSAITEGRRSLIERDVELWYRNTVTGDSIKSLSVAEFETDDRRAEVRTRIARAAEVLGVGEAA